MPTLFSAHARHVNCFLLIAQKSAELYVHRSTQAKGVAIFDHNQEQIEAALEWVQHQEVTRERDLVLTFLIEALSAIGMLRYSVRARLIPLLEQRVSAAQRLGLKGMEADASDDLGIKYAYLGYLRQALELFETARRIALEDSDNTLVRDIDSHIRLAHKQLIKSERLPPTSFSNIFRLIIFKVKLSFARASKNPFAEIDMLTNIANIYLDLRKWSLAIQLFRESSTISQKNSYRFGELQASMGLLQAEMFENNAANGSVTTNRVSEQIGDFEWSNDFLVFETLLELAPAIQNAESIAHRLRVNNNPDAGQIYEQLDQILAETDKILVAAKKKSARKGEIFVACLGEIKNSLAIIVRIKSDSGL